jgi:HEPN domain-containing protein
MSQAQDNNHRLPNDDNRDDIEQLLMEGLTLSNKEQLQTPFTLTASYAEDDDDNDDETTRDQSGDLQGALGLFAEATQDMVTATVELALGRHFACVDYCNQAVEKAAQSVSLLRYGHRSKYNHDLRALGLLVDAPTAILAEMERLTPFHPQTFCADTPPEEADEVINAGQANGYIRSARQVLRWAKSLVLNP